MSKPRRVVLIVVVVALVGAGIYLVGGRFSWWPQAARCAIPETVAGEQGTSSTAPNGGGIRVVEQGFSPMAADGSVSLGAIVENTSASAAYRTRVTFTFFDAMRRPLAESAPGGGLVIEIPIILPGGRIGVGDSAYPGKADDGTTATVVSFEVELGATTWVPGDALGADFTPVTATHLRTDRPISTVPSTVDVQYRETSTNCRSLESRSAAVVYRDARGSIVGGALGVPGGLIVFRDDRGVTVGGHQQLPPSPSCHQGERETWVDPPRPAPSAVDDSRTEVYPYCDLTLSPRTGLPGEPKN
ncbi:MAG: hypothetical protein M3443_09685 [Actinomycetota bacterium]|nr:hypothetical protein [Actinomycetota bacterium]